jgi:hypothetical protein
MFARKAEGFSKGFTNGFTKGFTKGSTWVCSGFYQGQTL